MSFFSARELVDLKMAHQMIIQGKTARAMDIFNRFDSFPEDKPLQLLKMYRMIARQKHNEMLLIESERMFAQAEYHMALRLLSEYDVAIQSRENKVRFYHNKGVALAKLKDYPKALDCFREGLCLFPFLMPLLENMAIILILSGDYHEAIRVLSKIDWEGNVLLFDYLIVEEGKRGTFINLRKMQTLCMLADCYFKLGKYRKAMLRAQQALVFHETLLAEEGSCGNEDDIDTEGADEQSRGKITSMGDVNVAMDIFKLASERYDHLLEVRANALSDHSLSEDHNSHNDESQGERTVLFSFIASFLSSFSCFLALIIVVFLFERCCRDDGCAAEPCLCDQPLEARRATPGRRMLPDDTTYNTHQVGFRQQDRRSRYIFSS
jgi:tetratricopeptide (TPR) repeat protein